MEIMKVLGRMVCTQRVAGLGYMNLRILENNKGKNNPEIQTDLTIGGIIDYWESD